MVLLSMTPAVVAAVAIYVKSEDYKARDGEPSLESASVGNPMSHGQLIDISRYLKRNSEKVPDKDAEVPIHLNELLRGCAVYVAPPAPKPEKSSEYKALMAHLRLEEEARQYALMLDPPTTTSHFPSSNSGSLFPTPPAFDDDEMTYADLNRQMAMIANVLISILACSVCVWKAAWHWQTPARLALSMTSSIVVAAAEVAIYAGYIGRLQEARGAEKRKVEVKVVEESWVIEGKAGGGGGVGGEREKGKGTKAIMIEGCKVEDIGMAGLRLRAGHRGS